MTTPAAPSPPVGAAITLRPVSESDRDLLCAIYAGTREDELAAVDWPQGQKEVFLRSQFEAQDRYYRANYTSTSFEIVLCDGAPAGRLYVARWAEEIRIVDIALLPAFRRRGIGARLLQGVIAEAEGAGKPVRIHVEKFNPALSLYRRLGFVPAADRGVYLMMERPAPPG